MQEQKLSEIFLENSSVNLSFNNNGQWIEGVISSVGESFMSIELKNTKDDAGLDIDCGDSILCKYGKDSSKYFIEGWISKIGTEAPVRISMHIHRWGKDESADQSQTLYEVFLGCIVKTEPKSKGTFSMVNKISKREVVFTSELNLEKKQKVLLEVLITDKVTLKSSAEISQHEESKEGKKYTANFIEMSVLNSTILDNFLNELDSEFADDYKKDGFWKNHSKYNKFLKI